eukprot:Trichotokara_eunicae@DN93_c0_g1_i3.p1
MEDEIKKLKADVKESMNRLLISNDHVTQLTEQNAHERKKNKELREQITQLNLDFMRPRKTDSLATEISQMASSAPSLSEGRPVERKCYTVAEITNVQILPEIQELDCKSSVGFDNSVPCSIARSFSSITSVFSRQLSSTSDSVCVADKSPGVDVEIQTVGDEEKGGIGYRGWLPLTLFFVLMFGVVALCLDLGIFKGTGIRVALGFACWVISNLPTATIFKVNKNGIKHVMAKLILGETDYP